MTQQLQDGSRYLRSKRLFDFFPSLLEPFLCLRDRFFNFRSTFSPRCFPSIFLAVLENPCSMLCPIFLAVSSIRSTALRPWACSVSAKATEPEAIQIGRSSPAARSIRRCNCMVYLLPHGKLSMNLWKAYDESE